MQNNKLLKRFLMSTALGAMSFSVISDAIAVAQDVGVVYATKTTIDGANAAPFNFNFNDNRGKLTFDHDIANGQINAVTSVVDEANIDINVVAAYTIATLTGKKYNITTSAPGSTLTIADVSGADTEIVANTSITLEKVSAAKLLQIDEAGSELLITGESHSNKYDVNAGTMRIQANATAGADGFTVADSADAKLVFDSSGLAGAIAANGNTTLAGANAEVIFNSDGNAINYTGDITGTGQVKVTGDNTTTITGTIGTAAVPAAVPVALIELNGAADSAQLILKGDSYADKYDVKNGTMTIQGNATAGAGLDGFNVHADKKLVFDSSNRALTISGNTTLIGMDSVVTFDTKEDPLNAGKSYAINYTGNITDTVGNEGKVIFTGHNTTTITGTIGTAAVPAGGGAAAVHVALIELNGAADTAQLILNGDSYANKYDVKKGTMIIHGNANAGLAGFNVADAKDAKLVFQTNGAAIEAKGDTKLAGANSVVTFDTTKDVSTGKSFAINYTGDITGTVADQGKVIVTGHNTTTITGKIGTAAGGGAAVPVALIELNGSADTAKLILNGDSYANKYDVKKGAMIIGSNATAGAGGFNVADAKDAKLVFDSTNRAVTATGNVDLKGANGTLETNAVGANDITITGAVNNGKILLSGTGTTTITGTIGAANATALVFNKNGTLDVNDAAKISSITGAGNGTLNIKANTTTIKGNAGSVDFNVANSAAAALLFDSSAGAITANGNTTLAGANSKLGFNANGNAIKYTGNIIATTANEGKVRVVGDKTTTITGTIGTAAVPVGGGGAAAIPVALIELNGTAKTAQLILNGDSYADKYDVKKGTMIIKANANAGVGNFTVTNSGDAKLVFDSTDRAVTATGNVDLQGKSASLKTIAAIGNNITIDGKVDFGRILISGTGTTNITGTIGAANATAITFEAAGTLNANYALGGLKDGTKVNFGNHAGTIIVGNNNTVFGAITNLAGSTIKMATDHNLTLGVTGAAGKLLNVDAAALKVTNSVTVADNSFFDKVQTGKGFLAVNGGGAISVKSIDGNVSVGADNITINALAKDVMKSGELKFTGLGTFTLAQDFGTFGANVTAPNANDGKIIFKNSGTITSKIMGGAAANTSLALVKFTDGSFALNSGGAAHYIDSVEIDGNAKVKLESSYNSSKDFKVAAGGDLDLANSTLIAQTVDLDSGANLRISEGGNISGDVLDKKFTLMLDPSTKGKKLLIMSNKGNLLSLKEGTVEVKEDSNSFADDIFHICDKDGVRVADGAQGTQGFFGRVINNDKVKDSLDKINVTGNVKSFIDAFEKLDASKFGGDAYNFMIDAGAIENVDEKHAYLLSAVPRNLSETMNNVQKVALNSIVNNVSSRMLTAGAADDLKTHSNIWVKGSYGAGNQEKSDIYSSSYDSTLFGGTAGVEFGLNETLTFGAAASYLQTEVKYNGLRKGDEDKFKSIIGSIYTMNQFNNNFIINGSIHFGNSTIEQKELKHDKSIFSAPNLDAMSYGGSIIGGYKAEYSSMSFTPLVGIGFSNFANPARKTVEGKFSSKASDTNRVDLIGGLAISGNIKTANMIVTPEIHGFGYYNVKGNEKQNMTLDIAGIPDSNGISYSSIEETQTNFTIGGSVTAKTGMVEYGVSVDGQFAEKYAGVLGSLKLKINL